MFSERFAYEKHLIFVLKKMMCDGKLTVLKLSQVATTPAGLSVHEHAGNGSSSASLGQPSAR